MKKSICLLLAVVTLLIVSVPLDVASAFGGYGHVSFRGGVWIGPGWGGWGPWWWGPPAYVYSAYPYYYNWAASALMQEQPSVYVEPRPRAEEQYYWYFCPDFKNYYPYVKKCPNGWLRVVPPQTPPDWRE